MSNVIVAVLNGGRSRRMGADKATVELEGRTLVTWVTRALRDRNVVFVGQTVPDSHSIEDADGAGPLAGLAAALTIGADAVLLVAVDQPWIRSETVAHLIDRFDQRPVVPFADGTRQVTCAVYPATLAADAAALASDGSALQALLDDRDIDLVAPDEWQTWGEDGRSWFGADTPGDLRAGRDRFGIPGG